MVPKPPRTSGFKILIWVLICVALLICMGMLAIAPYMMNGSEKDVTVRIPKGATIENVKDTLYKYFPEDYSDKVLRLLNVYGFDPEKRHGLYELPKGGCLVALLRISLIRCGRADARRF